MSKSNLKNFPRLKTNIPRLKLKPFTSEDVPFLHQLLSDRDIQSTLFRSNIKINKAKIAEIPTKMAASEKPKDITYVIYLRDVRIGYTKAKLFDYNNKSCYTSIAIATNPKLRKKGYAKAAYIAFLEYLFSLGMYKIYARIYETNTPSINLHLSAGFSVVGRQKYFLVRNNNEAYDALFMQKLNPQAHFEHTQRENMTNHLISYLSGAITDTDLQSSIQRLAESNDELLSHISKVLYLDSFITPVYHYTPPISEVKTLQLIFPIPQKFTKILSYNIKTTNQFIYRWGQFYSALKAGHPYLGLPITKTQLRAETQAVKLYSRLTEKGTTHITLLPGDTPSAHSILKGIFLAREVLFTPTHFLQAKAHVKS